MKKRKDGLYMTNVTIGHDATGKAIRKSVYGKTIRDVKEKALELQKKPLYNISNITFKELADECFKEKEKLVGYNTQKCYDLQLQKLSSLFPKPAASVTLTDIQGIIYDAYEKGYAKSTLQKIKIVYGQIADFGILKGIDMKNYSKQIKIPKKASVTERTALTEEEIATVRSSKDAPFYEYAACLLYTGLRRGEICGLKWGDIDFEKNTISISRSIEFISNHPEVKTPKTKAGVRTVPLLPQLKEILFPLKGEPDHFIFGDEKPLSRTMVVKRWKNYIEATGLTGVTQHQFRHTYATMLYKAGVDVKSAQSILGHSDISVTMNIYTHIDEEMNKKAGEKLSQFLASS